MMIAMHHFTTELALAAVIFLGWMGIVMTWTLYLWQRTMNGNRRVPSWVVLVQCVGWTLLLVRTMYHLVYVQQVPPSWWLVGAIALMDTGQIGHLYYILKRKHYEGSKHV